MKVFIRYRPTWSVISKERPWVAYYCEPPFSYRTVFEWDLFRTWTEALAWAREKTQT